MEKIIIYIFEDFPMQVEFLKVVFKKEQRFDTYFFTDGLQGYNMVLEKKPDVMLLDIILPTLTGLAVTRLLKFHDDYKSIPILVTSSITDPDLKEQVEKAGADMFLSKTFSAEELIEKLNILLASEVST